MNSFYVILENILLFVRYAGIIVITIGGLAVLAVDSIRSRFSPSKVLGIAASALVAAVLFWILPDLVSYARYGSNTIVPNVPIGSYGQ